MRNASESNGNKAEQMEESNKELEDRNLEMTRKKRAMSLKMKRTL